MARIKERHVYKLFGSITVLEKCVFGYDVWREAPYDKGEHGDQEKHQTPKASDYEDLYDTLPIFKNPALQIIAFIVMLVLAYLTFQYAAIQNCPEKFQTEKAVTSLSQCEAKLTDFESELHLCQEKNKKYSKEISDIAVAKTDLETKLQKAENEVSSLKAELKSTREQEAKLQEEIKIFEQEKDTLSKELSNTKYSLGTCKNKNMDHEVRSLELLQENEGLKKELKAC